MAKNLHRKLVFSRVSKDKQFIVNYYDTGTLACCWHDAGVAKSGVDIAFLRVNSLKDVYNRGELKRFITLIEQIASPKIHAMTIEYNDGLYRDVLDYALSERKESPHFRFAMLASAVADTRGLTFDEIKSLADKAKDRLDEVVEYALYDKFFRKDIGQFSFYEEGKSVSIKDIEEKSSILDSFLKSEVYDLMLKRRHAGIVTAALEVPKNRSNIKEIPRGGFAKASSILTRDELNQLNVLVKQYYTSGFYYVSIEMSVLLGYALIVYGENTVVEMLQFFQNFRKEDEESQYNARFDALDFNKLNDEAAGVTFQSTLNALDYIKENEGTPFEWAMLIAA